MQYVISLTIQKVIEVPEETDQDEDEEKSSSAVINELSAAGWRVDLTSFEPVDEDEEEDDEEDDDDDDDDDEE